MNGSPDHLAQRRYSGPGGGYTRDYDKDWELRSQGSHKRGWDWLVVLNEQCARRNASATAAALIHGSDGSLPASGLGGPGLLYLSDNFW